MTEKNKITVSEGKFNAVVTLTVSGSTDKEEIKWIARRFFEEEYDSSPSKVVAEKKKYTGESGVWEVMVADHSSGSLKQNKEYEI